MTNTRMDFDTFLPLLHQTFRLAVDSGPVDLELVDCSKLPDHTGPGRKREPFSLLFRGPASPVHPQRIYTVEHQQIGPLEIFLVPVARTAAGIEYQAIFN